MYYDSSVQKLAQRKCLANSVTSPSNQWKLWVLNSAIGLSQWIENLNVLKRLCLVWKEYGNVLSTTWYVCYGLYRGSNLVDSTEKMFSLQVATSRRYCGRMIFWLRPYGRHTTHRFNIWRVGIRPHFSALAHVNSTMFAYTNGQHVSWPDWSARNTWFISCVLSCVKYKTGKIPSALANGSLRRGKQIHRRGSNSNAAKCYQMTKKCSISI